MNAEDIEIICFVQSAMNYIDYTQQTVCIFTGLTYLDKAINRYHRPSIPEENISAIVSMSETVRVTSVPIGVLSKYLSLNLIILL